MKDTEQHCAQLARRNIPGMVIIAIALLAWSNGQRVLADADITFKGTLREPPSCMLNGGNTVYVSFGDTIGIAKVSSGIYRQPMDMGIECEDNTQSMQLRLSWTGIPAGFDAENATVVTTEQEMLGVKIYADGKALELNTPLNISSTALPPLEAVLVQKDGVELAEGAFTARATLRAEYQ